jgi:hypothetical protein
MLLLKNLFSIRFYSLNPFHPSYINDLLGVQGIAKEQASKKYKFKPFSEHQIRRK